MKNNSTVPFRRIITSSISPKELKRAIKEGHGAEVIQPFDEIDIPLDTGGKETFVCAYVDNRMARFVMRECRDKAVMNEENTNKTGYYGSKGRKHVLEDIYPHLVQEWKDIITPRELTENINGERVDYADPMWLPSATDVFGKSEDGYWEDLDDSFQLPIFEKERDRVKECGDYGTYPYWLRSVNAVYMTNFRGVGASGGSNDNYAYASLGFVPGFDI